MNKMANNLGKLRKEFSLTQSDLAKLLDTSSTNIGYYEQENDGSDNGAI